MKPVASRPLHALDQQKGPNRPIVDVCSFEKTLFLISWKKKGEGVRETGSTLSVGCSPVLLRLHLYIIVQ